MRVLVVEDERALADAIVRGLRREGMAVDVAYDGDTGHEKSTITRYDVVVLDRDLPGMPGDRLCTEIVGSGSTTRVLMLTASGTLADKVDGFSRGADDYLAKPFSYAVLVARLRALRRRGARPRPTVLEAGDIRLDPAARRVWLRDESIDLTRREFAILEYFVHHPDEVLAKRDILDHVWDFDFDGDPNIVEVYVRRLRIKLPRPGDGTLIETVRGAGYRLVVARD